jgi:hypothetical protein
MTGTFSTAEELRLLLEALNVGDKQTKKARSVGAALADLFGLEQEPRDEMRAFIRLLDLVARLKSDVSDLDLEPKHLERIGFDVEKIQLKIVGVGQHNTMETWRSNIPASFGETLSYIEMALAGRASYPDLSEEAEQLSLKLDEFREEFINSDLPKPLIDAILNHLAAVAISLHNIRVWGADGLNEAVVSLAGEIAIAAALEPDVKTDKSWKPLTGFLGSALEILTKANRLNDEATKLISSGSELAEKLQSLGG